MPKPPSADLAEYGRIGAYESWSRTEDWTARTAPARAAADEKFYDAVDPNRELSPAEREKRAAAARKAHFRRLALKSAQVRKARREGGAP
jgi:hypothetical protein